VQGCCDDLIFFGEAALSLPLHGLAASVARKTRDVASQQNSKFILHACLGGPVLNVSDDAGIRFMTTEEQQPDLNQSVELKLIFSTHSLNMIKSLRPCVSR
jgi:hypothetical protein